MTQPHLSPSAHLSPEQARGLLKEMIATHQQGKLDEAEQGYLRIIAAYPNHANALQLLGVIHGSRGAHAKAAELMEKSLAIDPQQPHVRANLGRSYYRQKLYDKAEQHFRRALETKPDLIDAQIGLASILEVKGNWEEARKLLEQVLSLKPDHPIALLNLGALLIGLGDYAKAEALLLKTAPQHTTNVDYFNALGTALQQQGKFKEAVVQFQCAIALNPDSAEGHTNLGFAYYDLRDHEKAEIHCKKACELNPFSPVACNNYSITLHAIGRVLEAETMAKKAIELKPTYANAYNNLGNALHSQGKDKEAEASYRKAVELSPRYVQAYRNQSQVRKYKDTAEDQALISLMETMYHAPDAKEVERMHLGFALGKAYDDLKKPNVAFPYYLEGNRLRRKQMVYDAASVTAYFNEIKKVFIQDFADFPLTSDIEDSTPFFILGMPRSGTTLVEQILASHPDVFGAEELSYMGNIANKKCVEWFGQPYPRFLPKANQEDLEKIGQAYLEKLRTHHATAKHITDKMPANFQYIGLILKTLPNAKIIHCKRSPMDNCFSIFKYYFVGAINYAYDLKELGEYYLLYDDMMAHWEKIYPEKIFTVNYERMTEEPEKLIPQLLEFCGLPWNDACLSFHSTKRDVRTASAMQVRQPIYKSSVEAWRVYESHLGPLQNALKLTR